MGGRAAERLPLDILFVAAGLALLLGGGELFVRGAANLALALRLSPMLIGVVVVGFGTSLPELVTSLGAAWSGAAGLAVGNVVGSNIANILLILGLAAALAPIPVAQGVLRREGLAVALATLLGGAVLMTGNLGSGAAAVLLAGFAVYLAASLRGAHATPPEDAAPRPSVWPNAALALGGLVPVLAGADLLVRGGVGLARGWGVSETLIGVTVLAVGTSLPELVTSVVAARRGQSALALGNVFGSNVFNLLGILGATALVAPVPVPDDILRIDLWAMAAATGLMLWVAASGARITRGEGGVLLGLWLVWTAGRAALG